MDLKLTARDVLSRYMEEDLPEFLGVKLIDVNQKGLHGSTPLSVAATRGDVEEVRALLEGGADPNGRGEHGVTPLHDAVGQEHVEVARLLIRKGARIDIAADFGGTPKDWAVKSKNPLIIGLFSSQIKND